MPEYYSIISLFPPTLIDLPNGKRYAVSGSCWIEVDDTVTFDMVQKAWIPLKPVANNTPSKRLDYVVMSSDGKTKYSVVNNNGSWSCSCPAFGFRKDCKHIKSVKNSK